MFLTMAMGAILTAKSLVSVSDKTFFLLEQDSMNQIFTTMAETYVERSANRFPNTSRTF